MFREFPLIAGVRPVDGEPLRYYVRSRTSRDEYLVDLEECGFNGACGCQHFQIRLIARMREDRRQIKNGDLRPKRQCWHIQRALLFHAELSVRILVKIERTKNLKANENIGNVDKRAGKEPGLRSGDIEYKSGRRVYYLGRDSRRL